jgi:hypothetical protein
MHPRTLAIVVTIMLLLAVLTPIVLTRYYLTPASEQRVIEQARATP